MLNKQVCQRCIDSFGGTKWNGDKSGFNAFLHDSDDVMWDAGRVHCPNMNNTMGNKDIPKDCLCAAEQVVSQ